MKRFTETEELNPALVKDSLTEVLRNGAKKILQEALEIEIETFLEGYRELTLSDGRRRIVRNGYHKQRSILTGIGPIDAEVPRAYDREGSLNFTSSILPAYLRKTKSVEELLPWLYLKGISTGDFPEALSALIGSNAKGLSPNVISRLKGKWEDEYHNWRARDLSGKHYVYFWVDGVYCNVRMDDNKQCLLVIIGALEDGKKELVALEEGYRESEQSWKEVLIDLKDRGLKEWPKIAAGDGAMGFWAALRKVAPETKEQRCWMHKTGNILNNMPKNLQAKAKDHIHQIWMAATLKEAEKAFNSFIEKYEAKYPKATQCLAKDKEKLLTFYNFPGEHWRHLRTTNPIESTFATVKLRTNKVRGCFSRTTVLTMAFKLIESNQKRWQRLHSSHLLGKLIEGIKFINGIAEQYAA